MTARRLVSRCAAAGLPVKVISGLRTFEEQEALFLQHHTPLRGGQSKHNFGKAFDLWPLKKMKYSTEEWTRIGKIAKNIGLRWGGDFKWRDYGHCELPG